MTDTKLLKLNFENSAMKKPNSRINKKSLEFGIEAAGDSKLTSLTYKPKCRCNDVKLLQDKLSKLQDQYNGLFYENEKTSIDLAHERHKVAQLERKLQFVKDNQPVFDKLREAYLNMKYNQSTGRKLVEIRDKSVQTWQGILCKACMETEDLRRELKRIKAFYDNANLIRSDELDQMKAVLQNIKELAEKISGEPEDKKTIKYLYVNKRL